MEIVTFPNPRTGNVTRGHGSFPVGIPFPLSSKFFRVHLKSSHPDSRWLPPSPAKHLWRILHILGVCGTLRDRRVGPDVQRRENQEKVTVRDCGSPTPSGTEVEG